VGVRCVLDERVACGHANEIRKPRLAFANCTNGARLTRRCSCQCRADDVLILGEVGATMGAGTPAGAGARRLGCAVRGLAADRQVR